MTFEEIKKKCENVNPLENKEITDEIIKHTEAGKKLIADSVYIVGEFEIWHEKETKDELKKKLSELIAFSEDNTLVAVKILNADTKTKTEESIGKDEFGNTIRTSSCINKTKSNLPQYFEEYIAVIYDLTDIAKVISKKITDTKKGKNK